MMVRRLFTPNHYFEVSGVGFDINSGGIFIEGCGPEGCLRSEAPNEEIDTIRDEMKKRPIKHEDLKDYPDLERLLSYLSLCNDSDLYMECLDDQDPIRKCTGENKVWKTRGSPTEAALIVSLEKVGLHKYVLDEAWPRISEIPFSSDRK